MAPRYYDREENAGRKKKNKKRAPREGRSRLNRIFVPDNPAVLIGLKNTDAEGNFLALSIRQVSPECIRVAFIPLERCNVVVVKAPGADFPVSPRIFEYRNQVGKCFAVTVLNGGEIFANLSWLSSFVNFCLNLAHNSPRWIWSNLNSEEDGFH